ncbi:GRAM domain-containing protein 2B-like isoform X2 [Patiria miniata]|nr:GRAM domain-containing protein 2B-like isoform X2 [Patiria miniata]XP_038072211.1 GRAM domain-containing protein 2B-like isoform X2 [Patiria miniata]
MSHPRAPKKRGSYWPSGTVTSKNHVVRRSRTFGISVSKAFTDALAKLEEMSNESRNRQFHKLFSFIPTEETVIVSYSCALVKEIMFHGRMFISQNWICFHSHIFTYETQVTIKMSSITSISKARTAFVIPNAIGIQTENEKYVFGSLLSRQSTYMQLIKIWKNAATSTELEEEEASSSCNSNDCSGIVPSQLELVPSSEDEDSEELEQRLQYDEETTHDDNTTPDGHDKENDVNSSHQCSHNPATTLPVADSNPSFATGSCQYMCKLLFAMSVFKSLERLLKLLKAMTPAQFFLLLTACLIICLTVSAVILTYRIAKLQPQLDNKPQSLQYTQTLSEWSSLWWSQQAAQSQLISKMWETIADNLRTLAQVHQSLQVLQSSSPPRLYNQEAPSLASQEDDDDNT